MIHTINHSNKECNTKFTDEQYGLYYIEIQYQQSELYWLESYHLCKSLIQPGKFKCYLNLGNKKEY